MITCGRCDGQEGRKGYSKGREVTTGSSAITYTTGSPLITEVRRLEYAHMCDVNGWEQKTRSAILSVFKVTNLLEKLVKAPHPSP